MTPRTPRRASLVARARAAGGIVVACANTKGGAGKSMLAWNLAHEYAARGARVLVIDTDTQQTLMDAAAVRQRPAAVTALAYPHRTIYADLAGLRAGYDVTVIDGQGRNDRITRAILAAVVPLPRGMVLVPLPAQPGDIWATRRELAPMLREAGQMVTWQPRARVVLVNYEPRHVLTAASRDAMTQPPLIAPSTAADVRRSTLFPQALAAGLGVCEYAPRSPAAADIAALATEAADLALSEPDPQEDTDR